MRARERADDVLRMYRLARSGGTQELLRWVSGRAKGWAGLLNGDGTVLHGVTRAPDRTGVDAAALATEGAKELASLDSRSFSFDRGPYTALLFPLDGPPDAAPPVLAVVAPRPLPHGLLALLADVAMPLALCWTAETVERKRRRVDLAESRGREAVLHLLMTGQLSIAHQVAGALKPTLPDPVRVCVVECPGGRRDEVARICAELSGGRSWIVRCPVYARHLILVVPADPDATEQPLGHRLADEVDECVVGASEDVPLSDTATGYRQAFHALAVARGLPVRHARFGSAPDAALVVGAAGARWADGLLHPLLTYLPRRSHDPGSQELAATLTSWLAFSSHATQHLKIHRNTLTARLRLIGELLGVDLNRVASTRPPSTWPCASAPRRPCPGRSARTRRRRSRPTGWTTSCAARPCRSGRPSSCARSPRRVPLGARPIRGRRCAPGWTARPNWARRPPRWAFRCRESVSVSRASNRLSSARCSRHRVRVTTCGWPSGRWMSRGPTPLGEPERGRVRPGPDTPPSGGGRASAAQVAAGGGTEDLDKRLGAVDTAPGLGGVAAVAPQGTPGHLDGAIGSSELRAGLKLPGARGNGQDVIRTHGHLPCATGHLPCATPKGLRICGKDRTERGEGRDAPSRPSPRVHAPAVGLLRRNPRGLLTGRS